jgi:hypothetical protein
MDFLPPFVILLAAFVDGPALVQIITGRCRSCSC